MSYIKLGFFFFFIINTANFINMSYAILIALYISKEIFSVYIIINSVVLSLGAFYQITHYLLSKHYTKRQFDKDFDLEGLNNLILNFSLLFTAFLTFVSFFIIQNKYPNISFNAYIYIYIFLTSFLTCFSNSQMGILNGKEYHKQYCLFLLATSLIRFMTMLGLILLLNINYAPFISNIISNIFLVILLYYFYKINLFKCNFNKLKIDALSLIKSFLEEKRIFIFNILVFILISSDIFLFSINKSVEEISNYATQSILAKIVYFLFYPCSIYLFPRFSQKKINLGYVNLLIILLITLIFGIILFFGIKEFFLIFYNHKYEFNDTISIYLVTIFTLCALFQVSGEYLATRYVNKKYFYIITLLFLPFFIVNLLNNNYFLETFLFSICAAFIINLYFFYKSKLQ